MRSPRPQAYESVQSLLQQNINRRDSLPPLETVRSMVSLTAHSGVQACETRANTATKVSRGTWESESKEHHLRSNEVTRSAELGNHSAIKRTITIEQNSTNSRPASKSMNKAKAGSYDKLESDYSRLRDAAYSDKKERSLKSSIIPITSNQSSRQANDQYHMACSRANSRQANDTYHPENARHNNDIQTTYKVLLVSKQTLSSMSIEQQSIIEKAIDHLAAQSAVAQELLVPITSYRRLMSAPEQKIYMLHSYAAGFIGMLKVEARHLYIVDEFHRQSKRNMLCVLDFVISSQLRREGCGKILFDKMLKYENTNAYELAYDRPSPKMVHFMAKQYLLNYAYVQPNRYVFFSAGSSKKQTEPNARICLEAKWYNEHGKRKVETPEITRMSGNNSNWRNSLILPPMITVAEPIV